MLKWALKELFAYPLQLLASVGAVGAAFSLALFFQAIFAGESDQIVAYIEKSDADVWVMQKGVANMHMTTSFVWDWKTRLVEQLDGVEAVTPILYLNTVLLAGGRNWFSFIVGLAPDGARAGPWAMAEGDPMPEPGEVILPAVLVELAGIGIGDTVSIAGKDFTVSGLSEGTFSMANSVAFVSMTDLSDIMSTIGSASYLLVDATPGTDKSELAGRIREEVEKVNALPGETFVANDWGLAMQMGLEIIEIMTIISGTLAALLCGFTAYSHIGRKQGEIAVMKALGVRDRSIYAGVLFQVGLLALLAFALAVAIVALAIPVTANFAPQATLRITADAIIKTGVAALIVSLIASFVPLRRVLRIDPVAAFKT